MKNSESPSVFNLLFLAIPMLVSSLPHLRRPVALPKMEPQYSRHAEGPRIPPQSVRDTPVEETSLTYNSPLSRKVRTLIVIFELIITVLKREIVKRSPSGDNYDSEIALEYRSLIGSLERLEICEKEFKMLRECFMVGAVE